jgi:hypothetical protein
MVYGPHNIFQTNWRIISELGLSIITLDTTSTACLVSLMFLMRRSPPHELLRLEQHWRFLVQFSQLWFRRVTTPHSRGHNLDITITVHGAQKTRGEKMVALQNKGCGLFTSASYTNWISLTLLGLQHVVLNCFRCGVYLTTYKKMPCTLLCHVIAVFILTYIPNSTIVSEATLRSLIFFFAWGMVNFLFLFV